MADPTDSVIQPLGRRERLVTTFMSQNPDTGTEETLKNSVQPPQSKPERVRRHVLGGHKVLKDIEDGGDDGDIPGHIGQTLDGRALEAVGRDSIPDLLDGVVGDLELIAIGVDHLALTLLFSIRPHGRERGGRGRVTRAVQGRGRGRDVARIGGRVAVQRNALRESSGRHGWLISGKDRLTSRGIVSQLIRRTVPGRSSNWSGRKKRVGGEEGRGGLRLLKEPKNEKGCGEGRMTDS